MHEFAMHRAAEDGDLEVVKYLIEQGVFVDSRDGRERTPLHRAVESARWEVAKLLISNHCNVNLKDRDGCTPVLHAAVWEKKDIVHLLLQRGAQVNCADEDGWTLLHRASFNGWADVAQCIVESGEVDVNAAEVEGSTPLLLASGCGHKNVVVLLLRAGADVHRRDAKRRMALHVASSRGRTQVIEVLLEGEGLDLNLQDEDGQTPLHKAFWKNRTEVIKQLLTAGADTNIKNNDSKKALSDFIRSETSTLEVIRLFLKHGFFFDDRDYARISENRVLKVIVLKDVDLCTQSIVNRFHCESLPALYSNPYFVKKLPSIEKFKLKTRQMLDVENFVKCDIQINTFCNIIKARPLVLGILCVQSLIAYQSDMKRSASPSFSDSNSPLKRTRHN